MTKHRFIFIFFALLLAITSILAPMPDAFKNINITGSGGQLGLGEASAADLSSVTIGTTGGKWGISEPYQRKVFYGYSRFWVFYYDYDNDKMVYTSSLDGITWESADNVASAYNGQDFSVWFDGTNIEYARIDWDASPDKLMYGCGLPDENGTIVWETEQTVVTAEVGGRIEIPFVTMNSSGIPVITYSILEDPGGAGHIHPYVIIASNTSGSSWGSPTALSSTDSGAWFDCVLPLSSDNKLMAIYSTWDGGVVKSKTFNGSAWGSENITTSSIETGEMFCATVTSDDVIHMVFTDNVGHDIQYTHYHSGGIAWEAEEVIYAGTSATVAPVLSKTLDDNLYCFWIGDPTANHIYYKTQVEGTWDTTQTDWLTEANVVGNDRITCAYSQTSTNYIPVVWLTGAGSPYNVRFAALERDIEPWLPGYAERQLLSVAGAVPTPVTITSSNIVLSKDSYIYAGDHTANYGARVDWMTSPNAANRCRSILTCDVSSWVSSLPVGYTLTSATLYANYYMYYAGGSNPSGRTLKVKQIADAVPTIVEGTGTTTHDHSGVCWDYYDASHAWPNGDGCYGADTTGSEVSMTGGALGSTGWKNWVITTIAQEAIDHNSSNIRLVMYDSDESGSTIYMPQFYSQNNATYKPYIVLSATYTPTALDDKVKINVYKGSASVTDGTWTDNWDGNGNETYNYRIPFTIKAFSELSAGTFPIRVVVDTATLVTGGFSTSDNNMAKRLEWAESDGSNAMKYWATEWTAAGVTTVKNWNTTSPGTVFYITPQTTLSENTTYTYYLYVDPDIDNNSLNYSGTGAVGTNGFFEHFDTDAANYAAFLAAYDGDPNNAWVNTDAVDSTTGHTPTIVVDNSVLTLDADSSDYHGIASTFTIQNFRAVFGYHTRPGSWALSGMFDAGGIAAAAGKDGFIMPAATNQEWASYLNNDKTNYDVPPWVASDQRFVIEMVKYGAEYKWGMMRDDAGGLPDTYSYDADGLMRWITATDVAHKVIVASYGTNDIDLDWIFIAPEVENHPYINFPDITYETTGVVFCGDAFSSEVSWWYELAFTKDDGLTQLYWCIDEEAQLTRQPGEAVQAVVKFDAPLTSAESLYCYFDNPDISGVPAYCSKDSVYNTSTEFYRYDDFTMPPAWTDNTDYALYDRVEGAPTGVEDHYNISIDAASSEGSEQIYGTSTFWSAQTFKPTENYTITSADLYIHRHGTVAGNFYVSVRDTENTTTPGVWKPTGADKCSGYIAASSVAQTTSSWYKISFGAGVHLEVDITYALVARVPNGTNVKYIHWQYDTSSPAYAGGSYGDSTNGGSTWTMTAGYDFLFETYGGADSSGLAYICNKAHYSGDYADFDTAVADNAWIIEWTVKAGSWDSTEVGEPLIDKAAVGNVGGAAGRCWVRRGQTVKWATNQYYRIVNSQLWEYSCWYWPARSRPQVYFGTSPDGEFTYLYTLNILGQYQNDAFGFACPMARVDSGKLYVSLTGYTGGGITIAYTTDPTDADSWVVNPEGPFVTTQWLDDNDGGDFAGLTPSIGTSTIGNFLCVDNSTHGTDIWYIMIIGVGGTTKAGYAWTPRAPESWTVDNFTYGDLIYSGDGFWIEDDDIIYDSVNDKYYWYMVDPNHTGEITYLDLDNAANQFPGIGAWGSSHEPVLPSSPLNQTYRSPRLIQGESGNYILQVAVQGMDEANTYPTTWVPNYIVVGRSAGTPAGPWDIGNTDDKYKQATSTGLQISYATSSAKINGSLETEIILGQSGKRQAGLVFRYEDTAGTGYAATVDYNSGDPKVRIYPLVAGALGTELATAYDMPQFPSPWLSPGYTCRLRVDYYGASVHVYYSLWGNEWILCHDVTLANTASYISGHYGVATSVAEAYFDNFRFYDYSDAPPYLSSAEDSLAITVSPTAWAEFYKESTGSHVHSIRENTWYSSDNDANMDYYTLTNAGFSTCDVLISSSDNWTGTGVTWHVSGTGDPGDHTIGIWAGLDSDSGYAILVKPDDPANFLLTALAASAHDHFGLKVFTCTSNGGNASMSGLITLTAVVHT